MLEAVGQHALIVMPLIVEGRAIGSMGIAFEEPRPFTDDDRRLAILVASQSAQALERARMFEAADRARVNAEAANAAKSELLSAVSHDLRTPLNAIGGYTQLLDMEIGGGLSDDQRMYVKRIESAQGQLLSLVEDLLSFIRLDAGRLVYTIGRVEVKAAFDAVEALVAPLASDRGIRWVTRPTPPEMIVNADAARLHQILVNLATNAVKFTQAGGRVELSCTRADGNILMHVADNGPGIAPYHHDRIFEPFTRLSGDVDGPAPGVEGVGLGLAISRKLARGMRGDVVVASELGAGATFTLRLPAATA
jgi:signal transduction histidine kinase